MQPIRVFVGYDPREAVAYHTFCQSVLEHASRPVAFIPLALNTLEGYKENHTDGSNQFIYSRFLIPWLCDFQGAAIFCDGDMICRGDITELWARRKLFNTAVQVAKHDYKTKQHEKYLGQKNEDYPKKNWSSVMVFRNKFCEKLTPQYVSTASGLDLHQFVWAGGEENIGSLPKTWNYLVGEEQQTEETPKLIHYTEGGPWFRDYQFCDHAEEWFAEYARIMPSLNVPKPSPEAA